MSGGPSVVKTQKHGRRCAFSLVELLVSVAIIGTLISITLPAILWSREASRMSSCKNNLRQVTLGALAYESQRNHYPPGTLGENSAFVFENNYMNPDSQYFWRRYQYTSSLGLIMPFVGESALASELHPILFDVNKALDDLRDQAGKPQFAWFAKADGALSVATTPVSLFRCPSDTFPTQDVWEFRGAIQPVYVEEFQSEGLAASRLDIETGEEFAITNYAACLGGDAGGVPLDERNRKYLGLMSSRAKIRPKHATDGTSKTILYGETLGGILPPLMRGQRILAQSWLFGAVARGQGTIDTDLLPLEAPVLGDANSSSNTGFGSAHQGGVVFAAADGQVFVFGHDVDRAVLSAWCGRSDESFVRPFK